MAIPSGVSRKVALASAMRNAYRGRRASDPDSKRRSEAYVAQTLGRLKGLPQKMGQILSMREPVSSGSPMETLRESGFDPLPWETVHEILTEELGAEPNVRFASISREPLAVASLSQVHSATLRDGRSAVVKVQYPDIGQSVWEDLELLGWMGLPFRGFQKGFRLEEYRKLFLRALSEELNYETELQSMGAYANANAGLKFLITPIAVPELSSPQVLTMTRVEGLRFATACSDWGRGDREILARHMLDLFFNSIFNTRLLHADPHPGNYRFRLGGHDPQIVLYDFGSMHRISPEVSLALSRLMRSVAFGESADAFQELLNIGFDATALSALRDRLPSMMSILFAPLATHEAAFDVKTWNLGPRMQALLGDDRWALRTSAPSHFLFLMRGFHGLIHYLSHLNVATDWRASLADFSAAQAGSPPAKKKALTASPLEAQRLCVSVIENGECRVKLFGRPEGVRALSELIPEGVQSRLPLHGIDIEEIENRYADGPLRPGDVFEMRDGTKIVKVWLE